MQKVSKDHSLHLVVLILITVSFLPLYAAHRHNTFLNDDTYITLTYAKNIASGRGFVFNYGPPTLGTTTPLLALIVGGLAILLPQVPIPILAVFLTSFCWIGVVWTIFLFRQSWNISSWEAAIIGLVIIASGWIAYLGMEAYLFTFLLVLSASLFYKEKFLLAGFTTGLLFLTRGEGILFLFIQIILSIIQMYRKTNELNFKMLKPNLCLVLGFFLPTFVWFIYASYTFGDFLPNTLSAKRAQGQSTEWHSFARQLVRKWVYLWGNNFTLVDIPLKNLWRLLVLIGLITVISQRHKFLIFLAWIITYVSGYTILGVAAYDWYQLPILFVLHLLFSFGLFKCIKLLANYIKPSLIGIAISICFTAFVIFLLGKPTLDSTRSGDPRGESYIALSSWIHKNTHPLDSIAYIEIGYLGYYTDNRIIDLAGLVFPDITPHIANEDFAWGFWHYQSDYFIYVSDFDWAFADIRSDSKFDQYYRPITSLPSGEAFEADFIIYKRISPQ